jgi:hypothetical protein
VFIKSLFPNYSDPVVAQKQVMKHVLAPTEEPRSLVVDDPQLVIEQLPMFDRIQKGDIVFVYQESKRILIYRPSEDRVVDMSVISSGQ